jgi:glycosyltransferase involved in cell wall biosynthesis
LVSVVMIFLYPSREFLLEAVDSVLQQSETDFELILVDDGSTNRSSELAKGLAAEHDAKIRYVSHPGDENLGTGPSRNLGLHSARGRYLAFLDSDDRWQPDFLAQRLAELGRNPTARVSFGPVRFWTSWSSPAKGRDRVQPMVVPTDAIYPASAELVSLQLEGRLDLFLQGLVVETRLAREVGGFPASFDRLFEDVAFIAQLLCQSTVFISSVPLTLYRVHDDSTCAGESVRATGRAGLRLLEWAAAELPFAGLSDPRQVQRTIERQRWCLGHFHQPVGPDLWLEVRRRLKKIVIRALPR